MPFICLSSFHDIKNNWKPDYELKKNHHFVFRYNFKYTFYERPASVIDLLPTNFSVKGLSLNNLGALSCLDNVS